MSPDSIRVAMARLDGWEYSPTTDHARHRPWVNHAKMVRLDAGSLPLYDEDHNALAPVWAGLDEKTRRIAIGNLWTALDPYGHGGNDTHDVIELILLSAPLQQCEAILRATGGWVE